MNYFVRIIQNGRWTYPDGKRIKPKDYLDIPATGITQDLKAEHNVISLWKIESLDELKDVGISFLTSRKNLSDLLIIAIPEVKINVISTIEKNTDDAETAYIMFKERHYDLKDMNLGKLEDLAKIILECIENNDFLFNFVHKEHLKYFEKLIRNGKINKSELKEDLIKKLNKMEEFNKKET